MLQCKTRWQHTYVFLFSLIIVPIILIPKTTQIRVMAISIGHSSSAYSLLVVIPSGRVIAAATIINCHPQKWILLNRLLNILALQKSWKRIINTRKNCISNKCKNDCIGMQEVEFFRMLKTEYWNSVQGQIAGLQ